MTNRTADEMPGLIDEVMGSPTDGGTVEMIVLRADIDQREIVDEAVFDARLGLVGDSWSRRPSKNSPDGSPHPDKQITLMNSRVSTFISQDRHQAAMAGDQLHVDLDLSEENLGPGTLLHIGSAVLQVTAEPHNGCAKFSARFGPEALRFINSPQGKLLHLRGINAKVVKTGSIATGDTIKIERTRV